MATKFVQKIVIKCDVLQIKLTFISLKPALKFISNPERKSHSITNRIVKNNVDYPSHEILSRNSSSRD